MKKSKKSKALKRKAQTSGFSGNIRTLLSSLIKILLLYKEKRMFISLITTKNDFDSADPSSKQNMCDECTQFNDLALHEFS